MYILKVIDEKKTNIINMVDSWEDMSINQFIILNQTIQADIPETYKTVNIISILTGLSVEEVERIPITVFAKLKNQLDFLNTEIPKVQHKDKYNLNGRIYTLNADISSITTAQYIDYQTYIKENNPIQMMSLWLIPEGHQYNDGYSMEQVLLDIQDMCFLDVQSVAFFLQLQFATYILIMRDYFKKEMKKSKMDKKDIKKLATHFNNMASSLLS